MRVLMITGDRRFGPGNERYELQKSAVERLDVVYWGPRSYWPAIPKGFDVVTVQDPFWRGVFGWIAARRIGARFNVQVHTDLSAHSFVRHILAQVVLRHADSIRVVSEKIKSQVEKIGVHGKISVLPVYIDISQFENLPHTPSAHKTILWIGRFEEEKNPALAIQVFKQVLQDGVDARLIMLGDGSMAHALNDLAKNFAIEVPIEYPGWKPDVTPYLAKADIVLCTSWHESFGASIVEALAAGVPVVAPDVGVAQEAGAIVVPRPQLAAAVVQALRGAIRGELRLHIPQAQEWKKRWLETL